MDHNEQGPHALVTRRPSGFRQAAKLTSPENSDVSTDFQSLGTIAAHIVAKIAHRHRLTEQHASLVCELSGIGGVS